jgi:hypothetical protein
MTPLADAMLIIFIAAWCVAVGGGVYSARFFMAMWFVGFRKRDKHKGYVREYLMGAGISLVAIAVGFAAGGIAELWGGGWQ